MAGDALDLAPLDAALADLVAATSGHSAAEIVTEAGRIVQSQWRDNILAAGLVDTGEYLESVAVELLHDDERGAWVGVGTGAVNDRGVPYPVMQEYGWEANPGRPVGLRAFNTTRARVVKGASAALERKLKSRARRRR